MRYFKCISCGRTHELLGNDQLLMCQCGEYESHLLIEIDKKGYPIKKEGNEGVNNETKN